MTPSDIRKIKRIYRRWLKDEEFFRSLGPQPREQFGNVEEVLRNLGTAIAYAQREVAKRRASRAP